MTAAYTFNPNAWEAQAVNQIDFSEFKASMVYRAAYKEKPCQKKTNKKFFKLKTLSFLFGIRKSYVFLAVSYWERF